MEAATAMCKLMLSFAGSSLILFVGWSIAHATWRSYRDAATKLEAQIKEDQMRYHRGSSSDSWIL